MTNHPRRILYVIDGSECTGSVKQLEFLARGLSEAACEIEICSLRPLDQQLGRHAGGLVTFSTMDQKRRTDPGVVWRLRHKIRSFRPDILHTWGGAANTYGRVAARLARQPCVIASERIIAPPRPGLGSFVDRRLARSTACIVVNSKTLLGIERLRGVPPDKLRCIPNGVRAESRRGSNSRLALADTYGLPPSSRFIAVVGRLQREKGWKDAFWALDLLRVIRPEMHLLVLGEGAYRRRLERYRGQIRLSHAIHMMGHRNDVAEILAGVECLWHPCGTESLSNAILEAMLLGVPVIAADGAGNRELIRPHETGWLVPVGDRAAFARQTNLLLDEPATRAAVTAKAYQEVTARFSLQQMIRAYSQLYQDAMAAVSRDTWSRSN